jgi:hypothetical protein
MHQGRHGAWQVRRRIAFQCPRPDLGVILAAPPRKAGRKTLLLPNLADVSDCAKAFEVRAVSAQNR